jgi:hypothetical protein
MNEIVISTALFSAVFPIFYFFKTSAIRTNFNWFLFAFTLFSICTDSLNFYLANNNIHNHFVFNFYDYFSFVLELGFILTALKFSRFFRFFSVFLIVVCWAIHIQFNLRNGFSQMYFDLSYSVSLIVCVYCGIAIIKILKSEPHYFKQSKHLLFPIFGLLIFESTCLVTLVTNSFNLNEEERILLYNFYNGVVVFGSVLRNVLFTLYFIAERRKRKSSELSHI